MCETKYLDKLFKEYQICFDKTKILESTIWQAASVLSIGSIIGFVNLVSNYNRNHMFLLFSSISAFFAISLSLMWWIFAKKWWSIQHINFKRMREIEKIIGFSNNVLIEQYDNSAISFRIRKIVYAKCCIKKWLLIIKYNLKPGRDFKVVKKNGKDIEINLTPGLKYMEEEEMKKLDLDKLEFYEYRGLQPVARCMLIINILMWTSFVVYNAIMLSIFVWVVNVLKNISVYLILIAIILYCYYAIDSLYTIKSNYNIRDNDSNESA